MMLANCVVSILRGSTEDAYGDQTDLDEPVQTHIPASIREVRSQTTTESSGRPQQVRFLVGRLPAGTEVEHGDRLQDEATGQIYLIDAIDLDAKSPVMDSGVRLDLRRVT